MKLIIGRDSATGYLKVKRDNERAQVLRGSEVFSPSVSQEHFMLETTDGQEFVLTNLNEDNVTYVDFVPVMKYHMQKKLPIFLGADKQFFDWNAIKPLLPKSVDISHLQAVWDGYKAEEMRIKVLMGKNNAWKMLSGILSPILMFGGFMLPSLFGYDLNSKEGMIIRLLCILPVVLIGGFFMWKSFKDAERFPMMQQELVEKFQRAYVCPNPECGHFFGNQPYSVLSRSPGCPKCKARFIKRNPQPMMQQIQPMM